MHLIGLNNSFDGYSGTPSGTSTFAIQHLHAFICHRVCFQLPSDCNRSQHLDSLHCLLCYGVPVILVKWKPLYVICNLYSFIYCLRLQECYSCHWVVLTEKSEAVRSGKCAQMVFYSSQWWLYYIHLPTPLLQLCGRKMPIFKFAEYRSYFLLELVHMRNTSLTCHSSGY